ncbi:MAG: hypothetical protein ABI999_06475 [Acidobacteriota bacterium]
MTYGTCGRRYGECSVAVLPSEVTADPEIFCVFKATNHPFRNFAAWLGEIVVGILSSTWAGL